jgi:flagellar basal-body rod protein FlgB
MDTDAAPCYGLELAQGNAGSLSEGEKHAMSKISFSSDENTMLLKKVMDANAARQKAAAKNLANATTEGYEPKRVQFAEELGERIGRVRLNTNHPKHIRSPRTQATSSSYIEVVDEDAVADPATRLERSVAELAEAELAYSTAAKLVSKRVATLRTAIGGK